MNASTHQQNDAGAKCLERLAEANPLTRLRGRSQFGAAKALLSAALSPSVGERDGVRGVRSRLALWKCCLQYVLDRFAIVSFCALTLTSRATPSGGDVDLDFNPTVNGSVVSFAVQPDDKVLIGGVFTNVNGVARTNIARLNADGSLDTSFQDGLPGVSGTVRSIVAQADGKVLIGGAFTNVNGVARTNIARLHADGSLDTNFQSSASAVLCIAPQSDGGVVIGGGWNAATGTVYYALLARLNTNGIRDASLQCSVAANCPSIWSCVQPSVNSVAAQADGKVLVGGLFTIVNGATRSAIVRLNADGSLDYSFTALNWQQEFGGLGSVNSIAIQPDGRILVGGIFNYLNATARGNVARLNTNGTVDTNFLNGFDGADGNVNAVALQSDGKVLLGGVFSTVNGVARGGIARLNSDGSLDTRFQNGMSGVSGGFISYVQSVAVQSDGKVLIAGGFTSVNGVARNGFARLHGSTPFFLSGCGVVSNQFGFDITGASNDVVVVEASTNFTDWLPLATNTLGGTPLRFNDPAAPSFPKRFYRARLQ